MLDTLELLSTLTYVHIILRLVQSIKHTPGLNKSWVLGHQND